MVALTLPQPYPNLTLHRKIYNELLSSPRFNSILRGARSLAHPLRRPAH